MFYRTPYSHKLAYTGSVIRHAMTFSAGILFASAGLYGIVSAIILYIVAQGLSFYDKDRNLF